MSLDYFSQTYWCDDCDRPTPRFIKTSAVRRCPSCHAAWKQSLLPPKPIPPPPPPVPAPLHLPPAPPPLPSRDPALCRWPGCLNKGDSAKRAGFCPGCHSRLWRAGKAPCSLKEGEILAFAQSWQSRKPVRQGCQWPGCSKPGPWCTTHFSRFRLRGMKPNEMSEPERQQFMATWSARGVPDADQQSDSDQQSTHRGSA